MLVFWLPRRTKSLVPTYLFAFYLCPGLNPRVLCFFVNQLTYKGGFPVIAGFYQEVFLPHLPSWEWKSLRGDLKRTKMVHEDLAPRWL